MDSNHFACEGSLINVPRLPKHAFKLKFKLKFNMLTPLDVDKFKSDHHLFDSKTKKRAL